MRRALILIVTWTLFIVPVSALAYEPSVQSADLSVSTDLPSQEDGEGGSPNSDSGAGHCAHCAPLSFLGEPLTAAPTDNQSLLKVEIVRMPAMHVVARTEKPPRL
jgi:hypothetical protein